jgi:hypothetical protein
VLDTLIPDLEFKRVVVNQSNLHKKRDAVSIVLAVDRGLRIIWRLK